MKKSILIALLFGIVVSCHGQNQGKASSKGELKRLPLEKSRSNSDDANLYQSLLDFKEYSIKRSNIGLSGSSGIILSANGNYRISQSIGQSSVIGTFVNEDYTLIQGFQEPVGLFDKLIVPERDNLKILIYPNPFYHSVNIQFEEAVDSDIFVAIYDLKGRILHSEKKPATELNILHLEELPDGIYIIKVSIGTKQFTTNLIKQ